MAKRAAKGAKKVKGVADKAAIRAFTKTVDPRSLIRQVELKSVLKAGGLKGAEIRRVLEAAAKRNSPITPGQAGLKAARKVAKGLQKRLKGKK